MILTRLMDIIQKTAAQIIEMIETRLIGEQSESTEGEEVFSSDRALISA